MHNVCRFEGSCFCFISDCVLLPNSISRKVFFEILIMFFKNCYSFAASSPSVKFVIEMQEFGIKMVYILLFVRKFVGNGKRVRF